jgi:hypothetical protein
MKKSKIVKKCFPRSGIPNLSSFVEKKRGVNKHPSAISIAKD